MLTKKILAARKFPTPSPITFLMVCPIVKFMFITTLCCDAWLHARVFQLESFACQTSAWASRVQICMENCILEMRLSRQLVQIITRNKFSIRVMDFKGQSAAKVTFGRNTTFFAYWLELALFRISRSGGTP